MKSYPSVYQIRNGKLRS